MALTLSLDGQTAIITGGSGGIGRATAQLLAEAGAKVTVFDIDQAGAEKAGLSDQGIEYVHCDMSDQAEIDRAYQVVIRKQGQVDILVNNVGIFRPGGDILEMTDEDMAAMDAVNVMGPRHLTRLVMNGIKASQQTGGCVTFVSSTQALVIDGSPTIYNVEKTTLIGLAKTFAVAGGPYGIRVNAVLPGAIATDGMGAAHAVGKQRIEAGKHKTPLGRRGRPEEIAQEIVNLCFATYTTGDVRTIDGGFSKIALPASLEPARLRPDGDPDAEFLDS